jgi:hypothetical protein
VNLGTLQGDAVGIFASQLKHSGLIQATGVSAEGGKVVLKGGDLADISGRVTAIRGPQGGQVHATAGKVMLRSGAVIDVSGEQGGGEALIGGGWQGKDGRIANAQETVVETGVKLLANATENGNGGTVVVWSDDLTRVGAHIEAKGGAAGGDGGSVETSGKGRLEFRATVDTSAPNGKAGSILLDPLDIFIANGAGAADDIALIDNSVDASDANATTNVTISEMALQTATVGSITLQASRDVIFQDLADNVLSLSSIGAGQSFTVIAGREVLQIDVSDRIQTGGGNVVMTTTNGKIDLGGIFSNGGAVTLSAGGTAGSMDVDEINTMPVAGNGGNISLTASGTGGMLLGNMTAVNGVMFVSSGGVLTQMGGTSINVGSLGATTTGDINLSSADNLIANVSGMTTTNSKIFLRNAQGVSLLGNVSAGTAVVDVLTTSGDITVGPSATISGSNVALKADGPSGSLIVSGSLLASSAANNLTANGDIIFSGTGTIDSVGPTTMAAAGEEVFSSGN